MLGKRILLIEDDRANRDVMCDLLNEEGHRVFAVSTAAEAIQAFQTDRPDLVLADFELPDRSGLELLSDIQKIDAACPIVIISGATVPHGTRGGLRTLEPEVREAGGAGYLAKPIDIPEFLALVERVIA